MKKQLIKKRNNELRRAHRTRARLHGTSERPRLTVFRSLRHIYAQLIDDENRVTLATASDKDIDSKGKKPSEIAKLVGSALAAKAKEKKVTAVIFDRGSYKYHGRVQALAEGAREGGLEF